VYTSNQVVKLLANTLRYSFDQLSGDFQALFNEELIGPLITGIF
jgi:hypothetical protein